jgi:hypothetical protein
MRSAVTLDGIRPSGLKKIYCGCGCIVGLDRDHVNLKKKLRKAIECPSCRNLRISGDIDEMDGFFAGMVPEEC